MLSKAKTTIKKVAEKKEKGTAASSTKRKATLKTASKTVFKVAPPETPFNKTKFYRVLAETFDVKQKLIHGIFEGAEAIMAAHLCEKGPGVFTLPGICKMVVKRKPATKERTGLNPLTGKEAIFKAKPARNIVRIKPLKKLKEMV